MFPHKHDDDDDDGDDEALSLFGGDDTNSNNDIIWLMACAFGTALGMFILETMLPLLSGDGNKSDGSHHGHSHHSHQQKINSGIAAQGTELSAMLQQPTNTETAESDLKKIKHKPLSPVAFMVLLGDGLHNITDGMAIGAAFAVDPVTGMATAFAVLCHELPHELGDFALLLQTGVTLRKALVFNVFSSVLSVLGMVAGLLIAGWQTSVVRWIYAGTAGTFLYIAMADLLPEMRRVEEGERIGFRRCCIQVVGVAIGGGIMLAIALYEHKLRILFE